MNSINYFAMANLSRLPPFLKLLGKLRNVVVAVPPLDGPRRSWHSAAAREIQLELDLEPGRNWHVRGRVDVRDAATSHRGGIPRGGPIG